MHLRNILVATSLVFAFVNVSRAQLGKSGAGPDLGATGLWEGSAPNDSSPISNSSSPSRGVLQGFCYLGVAVLGFGSSMVPVRSRDVGDGFFYQLIFCSTMALEALVAFLIRGCPEVRALGLLAGFLYSLGNLATVPIIKTIGLGLGTLIWSIFSLLIAWATARFGWFGVDPEDVPNPTLNYIGTGFTAMSPLILFFLKTDDRPEVEEEDNERQPLLQRSRLPLVQLGPEDTLKISLFDSLSHPTKRILGTVLAVCSGICYGCSYTPILYIKDNSLKNHTNFRGASQFDLDYLFPHMVGINALTTVVFFGYCFVLKNRPQLPNCVVPAFLGGSLHFVSYFAFFEACYYLGTIITYPIGCTGPALISLLWSVFYFKELRGLRNILILAAVVVTVVCGVTLITLSKIDP
ncbi:unnamed protein product [Boreogadus saida]